MRKKYAISPQTSNLKATIPPHLSMEEYCQFISDNIQCVDPVKSKRQKELEEVINHRFKKD